MSYVTVILLSVFLSSAAEASHGDYSLRHHNSVWGCGNCDKLGVTLNPTLQARPLTARFPAIRYLPPIRPAFPANGFPYGQ